MYGNPSCCEEATPSSASCRLEGRPSTEHVERLRIECGAVVRQIPGIRFLDPGVASAGQADGAAGVTESVEVKMAVLNHQ